MRDDEDQRVWEGSRAVIVVIVVIVAIVIAVVLVQDGGGHAGHVSLDGLSVSAAGRLRP